MPFYEYACGSCGEFQTSRPIAEAAVPHACPECGGLAPRALASPHVRTSWAGIRYVAESRNEKSAHEPMTEHRLRSASGAAHHHSRDGHKHGTHKHNHAQRRSHRPWMIGH